MNVYAKFHCAPLRIKKALGIYRELTTGTRTTTVAFWDPPSGSKNSIQCHGGHKVTWSVTAHTITTTYCNQQITNPTAKQAVVRGTTNPAPCCHLPNDTDLLTA